MALYEFADDPTLQNNLGAAFPGAIKTSITNAFGGPPFGPNISPYKMFGTSNGLIDTIYVVDYIQGFLTIDYNVGTGASTAWQQLFPAIQTTTTGTTTSQKTLIDVGYNETTFLVAFNEVLTTSGTGPTGTNDTVYTWDGTNFTLYNFQPGSGIPGTQYENGSNRPLLIDYLDISPPNNLSPGGDVLIGGGTGGTTGNVFVSTSTGKYAIPTIAGGAPSIAGKPLTGVVGPVQFYYDEIYNPGGQPPIICGATAGNVDPISECPSIRNIAFGARFQSIGSNLSIPNALQFSGNIAGIGLPLDPFGQITYEVYDYSIYSPMGSSAPAGQTGMSYSTIIVLASAYMGTTFLQNVVSCSYQGATTILPYNISSTDRCVATANGFYILSPHSCSPL
jgi:hypothetical protein